MSDVMHEQRLCLRLFMGYCKRYKSYWFQTIIPTIASADLMNAWFRWSLWRWDCDEYGALCILYLLLLTTWLYLLPYYSFSYHHYQIIKLFFFHTKRLVLKRESSTGGVKHQRENEPEGYFCRISIMKKKRSLFAHTERPPCRTFRNVAWHCTMLLTKFNITQILNFYPASPSWHASNSRIVGVEELLSTYHCSSFFFITCQRPTFNWTWIICLDHYFLIVPPYVKMLISYLGVQSGWDFILCIKFHPMEIKLNL